MNNMLYLYLFHLLFNAALFIYIGIKKYSINKNLYKLLLALGIIVLIYQGYETYHHYMKGDQYVINLFHVLTVAPLLIYIGIREEKTEYLMFDVLAIMGYGLLFHFSKKTYKLLV